jgi:hypothetical protein
MDGRRSAVFSALVGLLLALSALALLHANHRRAHGEETFAATRALVEAYDLTDPCLFTDARYTRHPSVADRHSAFQDSPLSPEHFPSGSLVPPPAHLRVPSGRGAP